MSALDEAAAAGADFAGLTQWLARIGLAKHESSVIPRLVSAGVLNVVELEEMRESTVAEVGLPAFERQKLSDAIKALVAEHKAKADAAVSANIVKSIAQYEKELDFAQLVATMRARAGNAGVLEYGCRALESTTFIDADNRVKAGSAGAVEAVVAAMRAHASNAGVQKRGGLVLGQLKGSATAAPDASWGCCIVS